MLRRRLTALIVSLLLLPSLAMAGRGCVMPGGGGMDVSTAAASVATGGDHSDHERGHEHGPERLPHAPVQCASVASCTVALVVTETASLAESALHREQVVGGAMLAPAAPALAPEPPPPRA